MIVGAFLPNMQNLHTQVWRCFMSDDDDEEESDLAKVDEQVAEEAGAAHHEDDDEGEVEEEPRQQQPRVPARGADHQQHAAAGTQSSKPFPQIMLKSYM